MRFLPVLAIMGIIFILSHTPGNQFPDQLNDWDKVLHTLAYLTLGLAALFSVQAPYNRHPLRVSMLVVFFCLGYGITDELHQYFIPLRSPSYADLVADTLGGICAVVIWYIGAKHVSPHKKKRPSK